MVLNKTRLRVFYSQALSGLSPGTARRVLRDSAMSIKAQRTCGSRPASFTVTHAVRKENAQSKVSLTFQTELSFLFSEANNSPSPVIKLHTNEIYQQQLW